MRGPRSCVVADRQCESRASANLAEAGAVPAFAAEEHVTPRDAKAERLQQLLLLGDVRHVRTRLVQRFLQRVCVIIAVFPLGRVTFGLASVHLRRRDRWAMSSGHGRLTTTRPTKQTSIGCRRTFSGQTYSQPISCLL